ncbi:DUF3772 domain-containing protein [Kaistia dalseonensis]|uniref:Small-conductance mechanosensitive channel n=1 Tax=Kaistia dalseonensis TaxID=410840 RepID=A0ABU0H531_9HYPH|nr:DUF3772 domain-containing protein [Kaistia dalseonensis]MCX5494562.1 DUF3772 domain-containing protein [Kaistia dalseonensis]MDQ0437142.1 small-conductance mechanosensitive channel [Kaistia dalseonensis]
MVGDIARRFAPQSLRSIVFALASLIVLAFCAGASAQSAATDEAQVTINGWNATLERIDTALRAEGIAEADLRRLRDQVSEVIDSANAFANSLTGQVAAAAAQVKQLAPMEGADASVSDAIKADRDAAQKVYADLAGSQQQAQAVAAHGLYTSTQINDRRRALFTARLLQRNSSLLDPSLWQDAAAEVPVLIERTGILFGDWIKLLANRSDRSAIAMVVGLLAVMVAVTLPGRALLLRRLGRRAALKPKASRPRIVTATTIIAINTIVPLLVLASGHAILNALDLSPDRIDQLWYGFTSAVVFFSLGFGLARALLTPAGSDFRLVALDDNVARRVFRLTVAIAAIQALVVFLDAFTRITFTALPLIVAADGVLSGITAILIILSVRTLNRRLPIDEEDKDDPPNDENGLLRFALIMAGILATTAVVVALLGYVALCRFIVTQITWITIIAALLILLLKLADEVTAAAFKRDGLVGSRLVSSIGFAPRSVTQVGVIVNGLVQVGLVVLAVLAVAAPWGVDSASLLESMRVLFFGFKIGAITISISTIVTAIAVFIVGLIITRAIQNWLDTRFLPTTRLDSGLRNSIRTSVGHVGWIAAAAIAFGYAGLDLSSIAIVAGALSVGIGLGLQSIVNNFVSGLILLAERPIRAGDWIAVGAEEGTVKRINVRATEIETVDRATVIVPNSSLISGVVKNMVLRDRSGRIVVPVMVSKKADAEQVRSILLAAAKAHPLVLNYPEPVVLFMAFNNVSLDFELRCYLADITNGATTRSDLRFDVFNRLRDQGVDLP